MKHINVYNYHEEDAKHCLHQLLEYLNKQYKCKINMFTSKMLRGKKYTIQDLCNTKCDLVIMLGWKPTLCEIATHYRKTGTPVLMLYTGNIRIPGHYSLSLNDMIGYDDNLKFKIPDSLRRWNKFGIDLKERTTGKNILVFHQYRDVSWRVKYFRQNNKLGVYFSKLVSDLRTKFNNIPIIVGLHPKINTRKYKNVIDNLKNKEGVEVVFGSNKYLSTSALSVTYNSSAYIDSIVSGVPCYVFEHTSGDNVVNRFKTVDDIDINNIKFKDRIDWCKWISHQQWVANEFSNGEPIRYMLDNGLVF